MIKTIHFEDKEQESGFSPHTITLEVTTIPDVIIVGNKAYTVILESQPQPDHLYAYNVCDGLVIPEHFLQDSCLN